MMSHNLTFDPCENGVDWTETGHVHKKMVRKYRGKCNKCTEECNTKLDTTQIK